MVISFNPLITQMRKPKSREVKRQLILFHRVDTVVPSVHTEARRWELGRTSFQARGPPISLMPPSPSLITPSGTEFCMIIFTEMFG